MDVDIRISQDVNYWAVLVAAVAYFVLGAIWYMGPLFGKAWVRGIGKTEDQIKAGFSPLNLVWTFVCNWVAAYGVARFYNWTGSSSISDGITIGLLGGICFVLATVVMHDVMENRPKALTMINAFYSLVGLIVVGAIIGAWH